jgi:prepilin peptidase CpaA
MTGSTTAVMDIGAYVGFAVLCAACLAAAWIDLTQRRIPNWLCAATAVSGLIAAVILEPPLWGVGSHALHMAIALIGGMALFALGVFGGGDAKFYAAVAAWFPLDMGVLLLIDVALCGLVLLVGWFTWRRLRGMPIRRTTGQGFDGLPYGIAIGAGAIVTVMLGWSPA